MKHFILKVWRGSPGKQYWEEFELELRPHLNLIAALMEIQRNPVNRMGEKVAPVAYEAGCLEEVCGSCSMLVNGRPRQACTTLIKTVLDESGSDTITIAPFTKFPLVRDLVIDRSSMFENLKKAHAWIDSDGVFARGPGPKISPKKQEIMYALSRCMTCGCCLEACPQVNKDSKFVGAQVVAQVRLFNDHPIGEEDKDKRMAFMMSEEGINGCGNAQNCVKVCPKDIPLTESIASVSRDATVQAIKDLFSLPDRE